MIDTLTVSLLSCNNDDGDQLLFTRALTDGIGIDMD